jgi:short-subunit dehydrogenase
VRSDAAKAAFEAINPKRATGMVLDLRDAARIPAVVAEAEAAGGGIDIVVNNAGYGITGAIEETSLSQARAMFDVNVFGAAAVIQAVLPFMRARHAGTIVNITSMSGHAPWAGTAWYGATKFALECLGQTLADEVRHLGIRVMNAAPGGMRTAFSNSSLGKAEDFIAEYAPSAHQAEAILSAGRGQERGDPDRAALAILTALDREVLPRNLFLGEDAYHHLSEAMDETRANLDAWVPIHYS